MESSHYLDEPLGQLSWERAEGRGFKPRPDQHSGSFKQLRRKCSLCNDTCKRLDFLVLWDKDENRRSPLTAFPLSGSCGT